MTIDDFSRNDSECGKLESGAGDNGGALNAVATLSAHDPAYRDLFRRADTDGVQGVSREELTLELTNIYQSDERAAMFAGQCAMTKAAEAAGFTVDNIFKNAGGTADGDQLGLLQLEGGIKKVLADSNDYSKNTGPRADDPYLFGFEDWLTQHNQPVQMDLSRDENWIKETVKELAEAASAGDVRVAAKKFAPAFLKAFEGGGIEEVRLLCDRLRAETKEAPVRVNFERILLNKAAVEPEFVVIAFSSGHKVQWAGFHLQ